MSQTKTTTRQRYIIQKLRKTPATYVELKNYLEYHDIHLPKRNFHRDIIAIRESFKIDINYDRKEKKYVIEHDEQSEITEQMLQAIDLQIFEEYADYIDFEKRKKWDTENRLPLLKAIKGGFVIKFIYHKYWENKQTKRTVEPYALKEFRERWYVIAKDQKDGKVKTFALDRISDLQTTRKKCSQLGIEEVREKFSHCFGIITPDKGQEIQEVILSFTEFQGRYVKSLPLHPSQKILVDNKNECRIQLYLYVTFDFVKEILSMGDAVKVIKPAFLVNRLRKELNETLGQYVD